MKVFVTGATGFIGKNLTKRLIEDGLFEIVCAGRSLERLKSFEGSIRPVYLDIEDRDAVRRLIEKERPQVLFHCAALVMSNSMPALRRANVDGTRNVLEACLDIGVEKVVYLSSVAVVSGNMQSPLTDDMPLCATNKYGISKIEAERVALDYRRKGLKIAILRPSFVYGEKEPHGLGLLVRLIRWRLLPVLGDGRNKFHLVSVANLVDVMMLSLSKEQACEGSYLVADKEVLSIKEIFSYIAKVSGARPPFHISAAFIAPFRQMPFLSKKLRFFLKDRAYCIDRLKHRLGYTPKVSVYEGLKAAVLSYTND